jgi:hypothetical protein
MDPKTLETEQSNAPPGIVCLPASTVWPIVLAFGITLMFAGLVTSAPIGMVGAALAVTAGVGWFRDVLPQEKEEAVKVGELPAAATSTRHEVERLPVAPELPRALLPLETYPVSAGIKGGLADPLLNQLISWPWFIASQFAFGLVAGLVVVQQSRVRVQQLLPFLMRAGFEGPGITDHKSGGNR